MDAALTAEDLLKEYRDQDRTGQTIITEKRYRVKSTYKKRYKGDRSDDSWCGSGDDCCEGCPICCDICGGLV